MDLNERIRTRMYSSKGLCSPVCRRSRYTRLAMVASLSLLCGALVFSGSNSLLLRSISNPGGLAPVSALGADRCNGRDGLRSYYSFARRHAHLTIKLLSELDGAPPLQTQLSLRPRDITVVTQTTIDRLPQLEKLATSWGGRLSAAVYVRTRAEIPTAHEKCKSLHERIEAQRHCRLQLQVVMEEGFRTSNDALDAAYPINALRNVALSMAATDLVFLLDVDFEPSPGLHEKLTKDARIYSDLVRRSKDQRQLLVVPAFRGVHPEERMPQTVQELRLSWLNGTSEAFRGLQGRSHGPTSYARFLHPHTTDPYHVQYREFYEPYFIAARDLIPEYDERFRGYGKNKISHAYKCAFQGMSFVVLPQVYVWENPHPRSKYYHTFITEKGNACKLTTMDVLYNIFKEELHTLELKRLTHQ